MSSLPRPVVRRSITFSAVFISTVIVLVITPVVVILLALVDLAQRNFRGRLVRAWMLVMSTLWVESVSVVGGILVWFVQTGGRNPARWTSTNYRLQLWWCNAHLANLKRWASVNIVFPDPAETEIGGAIVLARHASHVDAILPLQFIGNVADKLPRYTLKQSLQWAPAMDLVGNRLPLVWIDRAPEPGSAMFEQVEQLAAGIESTSAAIIFPEGTFFTPERHDRAATRLGVARPDLEPKARQLRHLLPPRPAGTLIMLNGAPHVDLVIMASVGLERFGYLDAIMANIAEPKVVEVKLWRHARSELPVDDDDLTEWLLDRWLEMDEWIDQRLAKRGASPSRQSL